MGREGLIIGLVGAVAMLVISVLVAFVVVQNVSDVDNDIAAAIPHTIFNESGRANTTSYTLAKATESGFASPVIVHAYNATDNAVVNVAGNITVTSAGVVTNASAETWDTLLLVYTYTDTPTVRTTDALVVNMSSGVDNVSSKIPTILLIAAVVLILGILIIMWNIYQKSVAGSGTTL